MTAFKDFTVYSIRSGCYVNVMLTATEYDDFVTEYSDSNNKLARHFADVDDYICCVLSYNITADITD